MAYEYGQKFGHPNTLPNEFEGVVIVEYEITVAPTGKTLPYNRRG